MSKPQIIGSAPQIIVTDVAKTVEYYCNVLGFSLINYVMNPPVYGMVECDGFQIHFGKGSTIHTNASIRPDMNDLIIWVPEIDAFHQEISAKGADVTVIVQKPYGSREFVITDIDGHRILIGD